MLERLVPAGVFLGLLATGVAAQDVPEPAPQTALSASYSFTGQDGKDDPAWSAAQTATVGLTGRWGQGLKLEGRLTAPFDNSALTGDGLVKQLTLTWDVTPWSVVTFGKQRLLWGTARVFSAIDSLQPSSDPVHPNAVLDGVTGVRLDLIPNEWLSASVLALPATLLADSKIATRIDVLWDDTDLSVGAIRSVTQALTGWDGSTPTAQKRPHGAFFADVSRFFDRFGLYGEVEVKTFRDQDWYGSNGTLPVSGSSGADPVWTSKATAGLQVDFPAWLKGTISWLTEYHYNGSGFDAGEAVPFAQAWKQRYPLDHPTNFAPPAGLTVGTFSRHYGFTGLSGIPVTEKLNLGVSALGGLDTGFVLGRLTADYTVDQKLSVNFTYSRFDHLPGTDADAGDLAFLGMKDQVSLTVTGTY